MSSERGVQLTQAGGADPMASIYVLGPMSVQMPGRAAFTPRSKKACALLALLALAPRGQRTRVWLRDKLWSSSDEKKSSTNLRQTVFELKRDLGEWAAQILVIDRHTIGLDLDATWIDIRAIQSRPEIFQQLDYSEETQLLEGLDVADEEFEDWLQMERQIWLDRAIELAKNPRPQTAKIDVERDVSLPTTLAASREKPQFSLGFLPSILQGCNKDTQHLADIVLEGVATNLREFAPIKVLDFRDDMMTSEILLNACETEYFVRVRILHLRDTVSVSFFLYRTKNMGLEWSQSIQAPSNEFSLGADDLISGFIAQTVDRLAKSLFTPGPQHPQDHTDVNSVSFTALNMMFQLDSEAIGNTENLLNRAQADAPNSIYPALQAYLLTFKLGENLGDVNGSDIERVRRRVTDAVGTSPFNSLSLACLGHAIGYIFGETLVAAELLNKAIELNPNQAFVWDHYALHKLYIGDTEAAYEAARRAVHFGAYSPIRYSYDTTLCMTAMMSGRLEQAIVSGKSALGKQPRFAAAMRYLTASYGLKGRLDEAQNVFESLLAVDPDFENSQVRKQRFRIANPETERVVLNAFREL